ncbi:hypothetical protein AVEN_111842-1 [Araneus ventricosus]|uniref:Uncharacterized protein n=1 Tax=Araneus ventricosus TaxID=182803 RepID=A0A4Y2BX00_ARAVE|nr:hypothetical protein AVEN_111842-1 [Araneus ventricosus]
MKILFEQLGHKLRLVGFLVEGLKTGDHLERSGWGCPVCTSNIKKKQTLNGVQLFLQTDVILYLQAAARWHSVLSITVLYSSLLMFLLIPQVFPAILQTCWY